MSFVLHGLGTAVPGPAINQADAVAVARAICGPDDEHAAILPGLYRQTGITTRHMVFDERVIADVLNGTADSGSVFLPTGAPGDRGPSTRLRMDSYATQAFPLALRAAGRALEESGFPASAITHLVTVSCTGFTAPGVDLGLMAGLGLAPAVERTHVGFMGCHGAVNGLRVARAFADADPGARVLLCAVELCSLHYYYGWDPKKVVANALFADGAAAVVGAAGPAGPAWRVAATGSCLFPDSAYAMTWKIGDHGFEMTLSTRVPGLIAAHLRPWLERWLAGQGLTTAAVGSWAIHPGGPRVLTAVGESLGLPAEALVASRDVLAQFGNMSSPTLLFILDRLRGGQARRPCVALGFGPGLVAEVALFT
jgi:predicted naringenin-chalcone synthase